MALGAGWWHRNTPSPILPTSCMTCIVIHRVRWGRENPFRSWMLLNSMYFPPLPALPKLGEERAAFFFMRMLRVSACWDSPNPFFSFLTAKSQVFSGKSSHFAYLHLHFIFKTILSRQKSVWGDILLFQPGLNLPGRLHLF